jgi:hypothetical protein
MPEDKQRELNDDQAGILSNELFRLMRRSARTNEPLSTLFYQMAMAGYMMAKEHHGVQFEGGSTGVSWSRVAKEEVQPSTN